MCSFNLNSVNLPTLRRQTLSLQCPLRATAGAPDTHQLRGIKAVFVAIVVGALQIGAGRGRSGPDGVQIHRGSARVHSDSLLCPVSSCIVVRVSLV